MVMFPSYFEVSVNFNVENRKEKLIILISILYPIYSILIRSPSLLCFPPELLMRLLLKKILLNAKKAGVYTKELNTWLVWGKGHS